MSRIRDRRRLLITAIFAVTAGGVVGIGLSDAGWGAAVGGGAALLVAAGNILIDLLDFLRSEVSAEKLPAVRRELAEAVEEQWSNEATSRGLRDAAVLPLRWSATQRDVSDDLSSLAGGATGRAIRINLDGAMGDEFEDAVVDLADEYGRIPSGRLVILGEPGAGKSVLALLLTLGLIRQRTEDGKVPILLSVANWDPVLQELDDWLVAAIAAAYYNGQQAVPRELLRGDWLLPVLDGLDEIPESSRRVAIEHIHRSVRRDRPIVVTCRSNEYEDTIMDGSPVLSRAPVIELSGITVDDLEAYLPQQRWRPGTSWTSVLARIRLQPQGPLALALSTPLTVSLAHLVYRRLPEFPDELLNAERFDSRHAIEDSLTARTVRAAYSAADDAGEPERRGIPGNRAERYLAFLARYLHRSREREFAWWQLAERQMSVWTGPALGLALGLLLMVGVAIWVSLSDLDDHLEAEQTVLFGATVGAVFAGLVAVVWLAGAGQLPGRLSFRIRGSARRLSGGFRFGAGAVAIPAVPVLLGYALTIGLTDTWSVHSIELFARATGVAVALSAMLGVTAATQRWLQDTDGPAAAVDPHETLRSDRLLAIVAALVGGGLVAALLLPSLVVGAWAGSVTEDVLTHWSGWPGSPELMATLHARNFDIRTAILPAAGAVNPAFVVLPGVMAFVLALLARPWPRYVLASWTLAARRQMPVRISRFLAEAHALGLLRRSTGTYQFRHVRLQEQLATRSISAYDHSNRPSSAAVGVAGRSLPARSLTAGVLALGLTAILVAVLPVNEADLTRHGDYDRLEEVVTVSPGVRSKTDRPYVVGFGHHGLFAIYSSNDPVVRIFTIGGGRGSFNAGPDTEGVVDLIFSPDGQWLFAATGPREAQPESLTKHAGLWRISRFGKAVTAAEEIPLGVLVSRPKAFFSKDGSGFGIQRQSVDGGGSSDLSIWSTKDAEEFPRIPSVAIELPGLDTPDVLVNWDNTGGYELRSTATGKRLRNLPGLRRNPARPNLFAPDEATVVTYSEDGSTQLWNVQSDTPSTNLGRPAEDLNAVQFSGDGRRVFILNEDGAVRMWDTIHPSTQADRMKSVNGGIKQFLTDQDGAIVAQGNDGVLYAWDAAGQPFAVGRLERRPRELVSFSSDGALALVREDDTISAVSLDYRKLIFSFIADSIYSDITEVLSSGWIAVFGEDDTVAIRQVQPDGRTSDTIHDLDYDVEAESGGSTFAVALRSGVIEVHDRDGTCRARLSGHSGTIVSLAYSPDFMHLASTGVDGTVRLWRVPPPGGQERCD